jgi:hypothetical protein
MKVFITMFNRFTWAIPLFEDFVKAGCEVILIDTGSTYPPILEYYKTCPYKIHYLDTTHHAWAFFTSDLKNQYNDRYIMLSDSDMDISKVPSDFVEVLMKGLELSKQPVWKSALAYELDDLPDTEIKKIAKCFNDGQWSRPDKNGYFECDTDVGIAIYDRSRRGKEPLHEEHWFSSVRTPRPYIARHMDWYLSEETIREEDEYYIQHSIYKGLAWEWDNKFRHK